MQRFIACDPETYRRLALAKDEDGRYLLTVDPSGRKMIFDAVVSEDQVAFVLNVLIWQGGEWQHDYASLVVSEGGETIRVP